MKLNLWYLLHMRRILWTLYARVKNNISATSLFVHIALLFSHIGYELYFVEDTRGQL